MNQEINGESVRHCGDINLVSALMSVGIPLDPHEPVSLVETVKGKYGSFRMQSISEDGRIASEKMTEIWSGRSPGVGEQGFSYVCAFIKARPRGIQSSKDVLNFAVDYLQEKSIDLPGLRRIDDIPGFVSALPLAEASYVLAYVFNRELCFKLLQDANRKKYMEYADGDNTRHAILDSRLPKWQTTELLSRLQG